MKSIQQVQSECKYGRAITTAEFNEYRDAYSPYDGIGFYHDGAAMTGIEVWQVEFTEKEYPYVIWFNK